MKHLLYSATLHLKRGKSVVNNLKGVRNDVVLLAQSSKRCKYRIVHILSEYYLVERVLFFLSMFFFLWL